MKKLEFKRIGFLIGFTLLVSIAVQTWRNYTQFQVIQDQLTSEIQQSLDNAVESYFAELAKTDVISLNDDLATRTHGPDSVRLHTQVTRVISDSSGLHAGLVERAGRGKILFRSLENVNGRSVDSLVWSERLSDSTLTLIQMDSKRNGSQHLLPNMSFSFDQNSTDSLNKLEFFTNKIFISITRNPLDIDQINSYLKSELERKRIEINYRLLHRDGLSTSDSTNLTGETDMPFKTVARSTFLPPGQSLEMYFENTALTILKRATVEILTSLLFLAIIAYAFYYLYQTIKNQKEIAEIKQDLIANITHEFKTPIATTLSAIEGIELFNPDNDAEKTRRYLGISKSQMHKLNQMVEKLLETATLDSEQLVLKKELLEPEPLLHQLVQKFRILAPEKSIELVLPSHSKALEVDPFHFENVLSNLLDNAVKYGGNEIRICLDQNGLHKIRVHDNGGNISSEQKERVFEQFYRIPKGDVHDVKGFGIGLFYVKKILEKHGGKIELETGKNSTTFITYWP